jgi:hypothetical protein
MSNSLIQSNLKLIIDVLEGSPNRLREKYFIKYHTSIYEKIIEYTKNISDLKFKQKVWHWVNNQPNYILCKCGNRVSPNMNWMDGFKKFCSAKCSANDVDTRNNNKKTLIDKYGVEHYSKTKEYVDKVKKTSIERYGVDNYSKTKEYVDKSKSTYISKYGVDSYTKTKEYVDKSKETYLKNWGVDHYVKTKEFKEKFKEKSLQKWGTSHIFQSDQYRIEKFEISKNEFYIKYLGKSQNLFNCDCNENHTFEISTDDFFGRKKSNNKLCTICYPISEQSSIKENMLLEFINSIYDGEIIKGWRNKYEIDIYLPELNLGFEMNGLYWHSEKFKEKNYHIEKTNHFRNLNIRIIHIWEDDWVYKTEIIKSQILNIINKTPNRIFARECVVKELNTKEITNFLNENHIQSKVKSILKLGLYKDDILVSVMSFDHFEGRKRMKDNEWNLNRFCNLKNTNVIGGASKLFKFFIKNYTVNKVISYADLDWSEGKLYYKLGFNLVNTTKPDYKYIINGRRTHKSNFRKSNLKTELTESEYMRNKEIYKVYDCGKLKFEFIKK